MRIPSIFTAALLGSTVILAAQTGMTPSAAAGKAIFEGKGECLNCHAVANHGGALGPDLTDVGIQRTAESIRLSITDPNAEIFQEYTTVVVETRDGKRFEGLALNEDDISIQIRDLEGNPRSFVKDNLKDLHREERSIMPAYASKLTPAEIDSLVAYLRTLRGATGSEAADRASSAEGRKREIAPLTTKLDWITRANRAEQERPDTLMETLAIPPGSTVVDLGSGAGYFTWRLAQRVGPQGKVIAVDIQQSMLDRTAAEIARRDLANVSLVLGSESDPHLPEGAVDVVFIANSYGEFTQPEAMMTAVRRSLKPDGKVVVIEYAKERDDDDPTAGVYSMSFKDLRSEIESDGLQLDRVLNILPNQHCLIFVKRP
jgi:putative heme-binding domain-containing protein